MQMKTVLKHLDRINVSSISNKKLADRVAKLQQKRKQGGFTLLELLVVVAILAAIAGTATIALQDTDARASAAAHVAMMDELNKGIRTFRVLNKNVLPTGFDSLIQTDDDALTNPVLLENLAIEDLSLMDLPSDAAEAMFAGGIETLQYVNLGATPADSTVDCSVIEDVIASRANAVVAGNIFMSPDANGCGYTFNLDADTSTDDLDYTTTTKVAIWTGGYERVLGADGADFDVTAITTDGSVISAGVDDAPVLMAVGLGPSSNLFNANDLGGMTSVPVYRHVSETEYNRFVALFNIGTVDLAEASGMVGGDQVVLSAIIDGAGDTKEEELGEWDGSRNTI